MLDRRRILCICIDFNGIFNSKYECKSFYGCMKGPRWCHRYRDCLRDGLFWLRTPAGERGFPFSAPVHSGLGAQPTSCTAGTGALSWGLKQPGRGINHPLLIYRQGLRIGGSYPWIPLCAGSGMLWNDLYLYLYPKVARKCKKKKDDKEWIAFTGQRDGRTLSEVKRTRVNNGWTKRAKNSS